MADELIPLLSGLGNYPMRLVDKGDGSWAERVDATLSLGISPVSATNPVPIIDAYLAPASTTWTTAATANSAATFVTNGYDTVIISLVANSAFAGGVVAFEVFDGTNWLPIKASSILNYTTTGSSISPAANSANGYQISVAGFPQFRVRLSNVLTAGNLGVVVIISSAPDVSLVTVGLDPGATHYVTPAQSAPTAPSLVSGVPVLANLTTYTGAKLQIAGLNADSLLIQQSLDGMNFQTATLLKHDLTNVAASALTGSGANGIYSVMVFGGYLKITRSGSADTLTVTSMGTN
jgi:hypothetical protein